MLINCGPPKQSPSTPAPQLGPPKADRLQPEKQPQPGPTGLNDPTMHWPLVAMERAEMMLHKKTVFTSVYSINT